MSEPWPQAKQSESAPEVASKRPLSRGEKIAASISGGLLAALLIFNAGYVAGKSKAPESTPEAIEPAPTPETTILTNQEDIDQAGYGMSLEVAAEIKDSLLTHTDPIPYFVGSVVITGQGQPARRIFNPIIYGPSTSFPAQEEGPSYLIMQVQSSSKYLGFNPDFVEANNEPYYQFYDAMGAPVDIAPELGANRALVFGNNIAHEDNAQLVRDEVGDFSIQTPDGMYISRSVEL